MKLLKSKKTRYLLSLFFIFVFAFIPRIGIRVDGSYLFFGFPAQWLDYYGGFRFGFEPLGFLFDLFFFYFAFILLNKLLKAFRNTSDQT